MFYLPRQESVYLTVRELDARYFYWLDNVQPDPGWQAGKQNGFGWPTATVIQSLTWRGGLPLALDDLGATARLGRPTPGKVEDVAPVVLYSLRPPPSAEAYCFVFRAGMRMRLRFDVFAESRRSPLDSQSFPSVLANQSQLFRVKTEGWPDGWYRLEVTGYALSNNEPVSASVRFYHARRLGG